MSRHTTGDDWKRLARRAPAPSIGTLVRTNTRMSTATTHELSAAIRTHHRALADTLDNYTAEVETGVTELDAAHLVELLDGLTGFLSGDLLPHAAGRGKVALPRARPNHSRTGLADRDDACRSRVHRRLRPADQRDGARPAFRRPAHPDGPGSHTGAPTGSTARAVQRASGQRGARLPATDRAGDLGWGPAGATRGAARGGAWRGKRGTAAAEAETLDVRHCYRPGAIR